MGTESRRYRRLETDQEAQAKNLSEPRSELLDVRIANLGPEGAFLLSSELFPIHTHLMLTFRLGASPRISVVAQVLWHREARAERGMGCQFLNVPQAEKSVINDYMVRRYAEDLGS